ncbi:MAG: class I SAM-dependent methyltransferase [Oryzomonas sp.]|uniref:class I SAM-dependent methyltransferase n=1 Tax=Oryzomonas sp. TaxID=2855186 RepID=UPI0028490E43|nr:class I SAM-dependent methyltransferase [Oryzomonas sp.]MDR3580288.1 class I SAM-dependent methyltransferase [Oryzomonas sp.]
MLKTAIINWLLVCTDPELRDIAKIIKETSVHNGQHDPISLECDKVFLERLKVNPRALKMNFWEKHFELDSISCFEEICGKVLDFGCGSGHLDVLLARRGMTVHGLDLSPIGINIANRLRERETQDVKKLVTFSVADVISQTPVGELFDSAWSAHVFEHIADPGPVLTGLQNWVKPGGHLLISVPLGKAYDDPGHVNHFFSAHELYQFLIPHIEVKKIEENHEFHVIRALCIFGKNHEPS